MSEPHPNFKVDQIDHVEFFVPDRQEAARWYERTLGLAALSQHEDWAADPGGPLMISSNFSSQGGGTMLALFTGEPQRDRPTAGFHRVAFRVDGPGFVQSWSTSGRIRSATTRARRSVPSLRRIIARRSPSTSTIPGGTGWR